MAVIHQVVAERLVSMTPKGSNIPAQGSALGYQRMESSPERALHNSEIDNQREHHRVRSCDDELRNLPRKLRRAGKRRGTAPAGPWRTSRLGTDGGMRFAFPPYPFV